MDPREGKVCYKLWMTKDEERLLLEILKKGICSIAWVIIKKVYNRGDFEKDEKVS